MPYDLKFSGKYSIVGDPSTSATLSSSVLYHRLTHLTTGPTESCRPQVPVSTVVHHVTSGVRSGFYARRRWPSTFPSSLAQLGHTKL